MEPLGTQGQIPEMESFFEEATVKCHQERQPTQNAAGTSGLRYSHLQCTLCDELVKDVATFQGCRDVCDACLFQPCFALSILDTAHER